MDSQQTSRGVMYSYMIGDLSVTYLSGKDANSTTPIFDMSLGEIRLENKGTRPIQLRYDESQTLFSGHTFSFGPHAAEESVVEESRMRVRPPSPVTCDLAPGEALLISRQDLMDLVLREGVTVLEDGCICTRFEAALLVDQAPHELRFGPHCFNVAIERDWETEEERYEQFFLARDEE